ncbi:LacI family transcriptional regulator [Sporolactobacillus sp. CPB3-1]|uniref:LacI family transcriptional regulator n=1 Tax=Sporolactobacillus mangiferae TaxID=2940498 RepID=A0ABT0MF29_9BACL|nr:LacI family DNA-binding transcriptional regulator [Sporolactobacillus mangiferae]MCL1632869.1 LacI family transcriptional regulator [Sporolactobacillus mangiferae]
MITIKKIAEIVGVSPTTVSNVIHERKNKVSAKNYEKVQKALKENNYVSNMGGRILGRHGSKIIGVILNYSRRSEINIISDPFFNQIIGYLEEQIRMNGYFMMLYTSGSVSESLKLTSAWDIEGLVILGALPEDAEKFIQQTQKPIAFIDTYVDEKKINKDYINIGLKDFEGGYDVTNYLIELGHQKIGFCADGNHLSGVDEQRFAGYKQALTEANIKFHNYDFFGLDYHVKQRHDYLVNLVRTRLKDYSGLVFTSDYLAVDAMNIFQDNGIRIPEELSITGFDHNIFSEQCRPKLTTIGQDVRQKAKLTIKYLMLEIHQKASGKTNILLDVELVIQNSTAPV